MLFAVCRGGTPKHEGISVFRSPFVFNGRLCAGRGRGLGLFITFVGVEGCGKSTQMALLKDYIESGGARVVAVREPGGTKTGERGRSILLNSGCEGLDPFTELFLYEACRAPLVANVSA